MSLNPEKQEAIIDLYFTQDVKTFESKLLPKSVEEQEMYFDLAELNRTSARHYLQLRDIPEAENLYLTERLKDKYLAVREKNVAILEAGLPLLCVLKNQGIDVIILNGHALAEELFGDIGHRPLKTLNILVKKEDLNKVHDQFLYHDLITAVPHFEDESQYKWPLFFDRNQQIHFSIHWNVVAPERKIEIPVEDFWSHKEEFNLMGETFFRLGTPHHILHLCCYMDYSRAGLGDLGDLVMLIAKKASTIDTDEFTHMIIKASAEKEVFEALTIAQSLMKNDFSEKIIQNLDPIIEESLKEKVHYRLSPRYKILHLKSHVVATIEKAATTFLLTEDPKEKSVFFLDLWKLFLLVPPSEALRLNREFSRASGPEKLWAQIKAPFRLIHYFSRMYGSKTFWQMVFKYHWLFFMCFYNFLQKKSRGETILNLESYARELGLTVNQLQATELPVPAPEL